MSKDEGSMSMSVAAVHLCAISLADGDFVDAIRMAFTTMLFHYGLFHSAS